MAHVRPNSRLRNQNALKMSADVGGENGCLVVVINGMCDPLPLDMAVNWFDSWSSSVFVVSEGFGDNCL